VVGVWVGSYAGWLRMYKCSAGRFWLVEADQGLGLMYLSVDRGFLTTPLEFYFRRGRTEDPFTLPPRTLGFYGGRSPWEPDIWQIIFPLWLPTLLLVALNGWVWRWTRRRKVGVGAVGFPVVPAKKADA